MIIIRNMIPSSDGFRGDAVHLQVIHHHHDNFKNGRTLKRNMPGTIPSELRVRLKRFKVVRSVHSIYRKVRISIFIVRYRTIGRIQKKKLFISCT